jgi:hypothetical protein
MKKFTLYFLCFIAAANVLPGKLQAQENWQRDVETSVVELPEIYFLDTNMVDVVSLYLMDRNLGATSNVPDSKDAMGDYYQWGRDADGHQKIGSDSYNLFSENDNKPISYADYQANRAAYAGKYFMRPDESSNYPLDWSDNAGEAPYSNKNKLWQGLDGENNPCPCGYRIPSTEEWRAILQFPSDNIKPNTIDFDLAGTYGADADGTILGKYKQSDDGEWIRMSNVKMYHKEASTPTDPEVVPYLEVTFNGNPYAFPFAGRRRIGSGDTDYNLLVADRNLGYYWTSTFKENDETYLRAYRVYMHHNSGVSLYKTVWPIFGHSVRCVRKAGEVTTSINKIKQEKLNVRFINGAISVDGALKGASLSIFDIQGRAILVNQPATSRVAINYKGLVIVKLVNGNKVETTKLVLN